MKKILTVFPAVICLILSLCVPISALADSNDYATVDSCVLPVEWFTNNLNEPLKKYYFHMAYSYKYTSYPSDTYVDNIFFHTDYEPEVVTESGKTTITLKGATADIRTVKLGYGISQYYTRSFQTAVIDTSNNTISLDGYTYPDYVQDKSNISTLKFESSFFSGVSLGDLKFDFNPELSGEVDYKNFVYKDVQMKDYPYFQFDVTNQNSYYSYQYSFFIVDSGTGVEYGHVPSFDISTDDSSSGSLDPPVSLPDENTSIYDGFYLNGQFFTNSAVFTYITEEWNYSAFGAGTSLGVNSKLCLSPSSWHLVKPGETKHVTISWKQIKLVPGHNYDCVAVACKKDSVSDKYNENVVNFINDIRSYNRSKPYEAYRSSFTVKSATPYDPTFSYTDENGNIVYPYNPDGDNSETFDKLFASLDDEHGYTRFDGSFSDFDPSNPSNPKPSSGGSFGFGNSSSSSGNYSITSFSGMFSNVFGCVSMFMGYLPSSIMNIYVFGFSCIVVIAVIKAVR